MLYNMQSIVYILQHVGYIESVLGRDEGYRVKYNPFPEGVPEGEAQENS